MLRSGAGDRDRTGTLLPAPDFKSEASANSATPANCISYSTTESPQRQGKGGGDIKNKSCETVNHPIYHTEECVYNRCEIDFCPAVRCGENIRRKSYVNR